MGLPCGHVTDVEPDCGKNGIADATINLLSDYEVEAKAFCAGNKEVSFTSNDGVYFTLPVSYLVTEKERCIVYTILVIVAFGSPGSRLPQTDERYTITCSYQPGAKKESSPIKVKP
ncbi:uncharacterized protein [Haliotis asinina]|uniref:uncharacterized protein n=1 Tax=Haliotis asinina TaxID=109174 RepID=UPI00353228C4